MLLNQLVSLLRVVECRGNLNVDIKGIKMNSKLVHEGDLFVCVSGISGFQEDRHRFADEAVNAGATALIVERDLHVSSDVPIIKVSNARYALAVISTFFYGNPSQELKLLGITGTNGKTTTSYMLESILASAGFLTGLMGNIGTKIGEEIIETDINTQEPPILQNNLRKMADKSTDYCVMEVTSQGLDMGRVMGCDFRTAIFTNLTQDHLDYHKDMNKYLESKGLLFSRMGNVFNEDPQRKKYAILNADDIHSSYLSKITTAEVITYGITNKADVMAMNISMTPKGSQFDLVSFAGNITINLKMVGLFNVYNALASISSALVEEIPLAVIKTGIENLHSVAGRMEVIDEGQGFLVLVDYAHTPDGLEKVLLTVKEFAENRVIVVFGCGGDRDNSKRPIMGKIAVNYSDYLIITSDNPRKENPKRILEDIEMGIKTSNLDKLTQYELIVDREAAIYHAINTAKTGDVVVIAGKGHETYQIMKEKTIHFDDREVVRKAIMGLF